MCWLELLRVDLKGVNECESSFETDLGQDYFNLLDGAEVRDGALHVSVSIRKASGFFELQWHAVGMVIIPCDRCLEPMEQPVEAESRVVARFGSQYSEDDDVITVPEDEGILDLSWLVYESVALAIPIRHVHAPGKCNPVMAEALEELSADRSSDEESNKAIDPRWEALLKLRAESGE